MTTPTPEQNAAFLANVIDHNLLEQSIAWIRDNLRPEDVFYPEALEQWAECNRWRK